MSNELTLGIIGLYTLVYIIVFIIQKSQINQTKEINASMKSFMDIFKIDEVKKYVELKNERVMMQVDQMLADNVNIRKMATEATKEKVEEIKEVYIKQMGSQHIEMTNIIVEILKSLEKENRKAFIKTRLPNSEHIFMPMLEDIENGKI